MSSPGTNPDEAARRGLVLEATITAAADIMLPAPVR